MKSPLDTGERQSLGLPYWRLSGFYFFYFAVLGALVPYWSLYLESAGYGGRDIGLLAAVLMATRILAPNIWGWLGDHSGRRLRIVRWGAALASLFFIGVLAFGAAGPGQFAALLASVVAFSFFWNAILSQFEVITLNHLSGREQLYSRIRLWGSIGFIAAVACLGAIFDVMSAQYLPWFILLFLLAIWLFSLTVVEVRPSCRVSSLRGFLAVVRQPAVLIFMLSAFMLQLSFGPYYTFFSLYLQGVGYSKLAIGLLWSLGVLAEVIIFIGMHRILPRYGVRCLLLCSLALASLRWLLIAYAPDNLYALLLAQCLHAFAFGAAHSASIEFVRRYFSASQDGDADHQGQGQSLYSSLGWGCGGALGALLSGYWWEHSPEQLFVAAAAVAALAFVLVWLGIRRDDPRLQ